MKASHLLVVTFVFLLVGAALIGASTTNGSSKTDDRNPVNAEIKIQNRDIGEAKASPKSTLDKFQDISQFLNQHHDHQFTYEREAIVLIKFPSCDGSIFKVFEYLDTTAKRDHISILGLKDPASPIPSDMREYYEDPSVTFRNHTNTLKNLTNISLDYPEFYLFENGKETNHFTANCNNFEQVIDDLESFLDE